MGQDDIRALINGLKAKVIRIKRAKLDDDEQFGRGEITLSQLRLRSANYDTDLTDAENEISKLEQQLTDRQHKEQVSSSPASSFQPLRSQVHFPSVPIDPNVNPFFVGGVVPHQKFIGRQSVLSKLHDRLATLQSTSIVGNRKMGKSSLLNYIVNTYPGLVSNQFPYLVVYIDMMHPSASNLEGFMRLVRKSLLRQTHLELWDESDDGDLPSLLDGFENLHADGYGCALCLDEWEVAAEKAGNESLINALRSAGSLGYVALVTSKPLSERS